MPGIVEFPTVVRQAVEQFGHLFDNERQREHFAEYVCGLMVAHRKTVAGINSEFAETTDQSSTVLLSPMPRSTSDTRSCPFIVYAKRSRPG